MHANYKAIDRNIINSETFKNSDTKMYKNGTLSAVLLSEEIEKSVHKQVYEFNITNKSNVKELKISPGQQMIETSKKRSMTKTGNYHTETQQAISSVIVMKNDHRRLTDLMKSNYYEIIGAIYGTIPTSSYIIFYYLLISITISRSLHIFANTMLKVEKNVVKLLNSIFQRYIGMKLTLAVVFLVPVALVCAAMLTIFAVIRTLNLFFKVILWPVRKSLLTKILKWYHNSME